MLATANGQVTACLASPKYARIADWNEWIIQTDIVVEWQAIQPPQRYSQPQMPNAEWSQNETKPKQMEKKIYIRKKAEPVT